MRKGNLPGRIIITALAIVLCLSVPMSAFAAVLGDLTGDDQVTTEDVVQLLLHISMPDMFPLEGHKDFDGDGQVDTDDAVQLLLHISMPDMFPLTPGSSENQGSSEPAIPEDEDIEIPITNDMYQASNVIDFDDLLNAGKN